MMTIVWDVDDVLNDLMRYWLGRAQSPLHAKRPVAYEDLRENPPNDLLGINLTDYLDSLDQFRMTEYLDGLPPLPEAVAWFECNGGRYRHMALTEAPLRCVPLSAHWVLRHFGRWIRSFHFVPSPRSGEVLPVYDAGKKGFLRWFEKADVMVDDREENVAAARELGIKAFLMPRPWNHGEGTPRGCFEELAKLR